MSNVLMKCGCAAQGVDSFGNPVCVVHLGIMEGADEVAPPVDFTGRQAICSYSKKDKPHGVKASSVSLPFFSSKPNAQYDEYYCGCYGWD